MPEKLLHQEENNSTLKYARADSPDSDHMEQSSWWTEIIWHHSDYVQKQTEDVII